MLVKIATQNAQEMSNDFSDDTIDETIFYIEEKKLWLLAEYAVHNLKPIRLQVLCFEITTLEVSPKKN